MKSTEAEYWNVLCLIVLLLLNWGIAIVPISGKGNTEYNGELLTDNNILIINQGGSGLGNINYGSQSGASSTNNNTSNDGRSGVKNNQKEKPPAFNFWKLLFGLSLMFNLFLLLVILKRIGQKNPKKERNSDGISRDDDIKIGSPPGINKLENGESESSRANKRPRWEVLKEKDAELLRRAEEEVEKNKNYEYYPRELIRELFSNKRAEWLDMVADIRERENISHEVNRLRNSVKDKIEADLRNSLAQEYSGKKEVLEQLSCDAIYDKLELDKSYFKVSINQKQDIINRHSLEAKRAIEHRIYIKKSEIQYLESEMLAAIITELQEAELNAETILYSSQPAMEGYFLNNKLSNEQQGFHMYKLRISPKDPNTAKFEFIIDNDKAVNTAIASYATILAPVCVLENDVTSGSRIVVNDQKKFGTLKLENDKWIVQEKLFIRIV